MTATHLDQMEEKLGETIVSYHKALSEMDESDPRYNELRGHFDQLKQYLGYIRSERLINPASE